jgi:2-amino-4-hydroxy-6-hydroxymethyldihydropteridine diphosphokinase
LTVGKGQDTFLSAILFKEGHMPASRSGVPSRFCSGPPSFFSVSRKEADSHVPADFFGKDACVTAYVSLGSNQGDAPANLAAAREALAAMPEVKLLLASSVYRTEPQGLREQPFFVNQAIALACAPGLRAEILLERLLSIENALGRVRRGAVRFGPRVIDLDLLLFGDARMESQRLVLPHPRMMERAFVLLPLAEIAPELVLPQGLTVPQALGRIRFTLKGRVLYQCDPLENTETFTVRSGITHKENCTC